MPNIIYFYYYGGHIEYLICIIYEKHEHKLKYAGIGLGKDFSLKLTILLHDLHIEILTVMEYNLYA